MGSPEVVCLSSDEEPVFARNQLRIKERQIKEEQYETRAHFGRLIDEVAEKTRKFLQTTAEPEDSKIPLAHPLDKSLFFFIAII